jgi:hypothetical protein
MMKTTTAKTAMMTLMIQDHSQPNDELSLLAAQPVAATGRQNSRHQAAAAQVPLEKATKEFSSWHELA